MAVCSAITVISGVLLYLLQLGSAIAAFIFIGFHYDDDCKAPLASLILTYSAFSLISATVIAISLHSKIANNYRKVAALCSLLVFFWGVFTIVFASVQFIHIESVVDQASYSHEHPNCNKQLYDFSKALTLVWVFLAPLSVVYSTLSCCMPRFYKYAHKIKKYNPRGRNRKQISDHYEEQHKQQEFQDELAVVHPDNGYAKVEYHQSL